MVHKLNEEQINEIIYRIDKLNPNTIGFKSLSYKKGSDITEASQLKMIFDKLKKSRRKVKLGQGEVNLDWEGICEL